MKFTYYTIIGKDLELLKGHVQNVKYHAGLSKIPNHEFIVIVYTNPKIPKEVTKSIYDYLASENVSWDTYEEPHENFIVNLYNCWNLGYENAQDGFVFRGGSDQVFTKDAFVAMYECGKFMLANHLGDKWVLQCQSIENAERCGDSRHYLKKFGNNFQDLNLDALEAFRMEINKGVANPILTIDECLAYWGHPTGLRSSLGPINRVDGLSWLMTKKAWEIYGPMPSIENGVTGDVVIHDRMQVDGCVSYLVRDCVSYHFVRGESLAQY